MKVYYKRKHVKTVPEKFDLPQLDLPKRFKDCKYKRLSETERFELEIDLYIILLPGPVKELIRGLRPSASIKVKSRDSGTYHVLKFGKHKLKCTERLYKMLPNKETQFAQR